VHDGCHRLRHASWFATEQKFSRAWRNFRRGDEQFLRLDDGRGLVQMGTAKDKLTFEKEVSDGWCVLVPAGTWHNITNTGTTPMQVFTIYAPAHHAPDKVQVTAAAAEADKDDEPAVWSVQPKHTPDKHG